MKLVDYWEMLKKKKDFGFFPKRAEQWNTESGEKKCLMGGIKKSNKKKSKTTQPKKEVVVTKKSKKTQRESTSTTMTSETVKTTEDDGARKKKKTPSPITVVGNETIDQPSVDKREYRHVVMGTGDNAMDVLLISDPNTDKSSAACDIYVGQLCDTTYEKIRRSTWRRFDVYFCLLCLRSMMITSVHVTCFQIWVTCFRKNEKIDLIFTLISYILP